MKYKTMSCAHCSTHPFALQVTEVEPDIFPCIQVGDDRHNGVQTRVCRQQNDWQNSV